LKFYCIRCGITCGSSAASEKGQGTRVRFPLDLQFFAGEKTEKATPKKRRDVRKKGQVVKSQDINTAFVVIAVFSVLMISGSAILKQMAELFKHTYSVYFGQELTQMSLEAMTAELIRQFFWIAGPVMLAGVGAALFANYLQVGFLFSVEPLKMKPEKLDPIKGIKRMFSLRALVELIKSLLKISIIGFITFFFLWMNRREILGLVHLPVRASVFTILSIMVKMGLFAGAGLLFIAGLDYLYQKYDFEKSIRMSKQDIKEEFKNMEGDPLIKSRIKQRQKEMAMRRMMQEVPKADVVITNPTHYAVALKYDENTMDAPTVVAKGADYIAQKIKLIAKENDVITVENRPLARALYEQTEIGEQIPEQFFKAVAEILAYVYRMKNKI